jgi:hypothetical protein
MILLIIYLSLLEFYLLPADFPAILDQKFAGNTFPADFGSQLKPL